MDKKKRTVPGSYHVKKLLRVGKKQPKQLSDNNLPKITNKTVDEHRKAVIKGAQKFVYPLKHSKHKIVSVTVIIIVAAIISFMTFTLLSLYKFQSTSAFMYQVTKILPFPVARIGSTFVSYEDYLFELRHYIHYFQTQQGVDFSSEQGKRQLEDQRTKSLNNVIDYAYIKRIAKEKNINVTNKEVDDQIKQLRVQNRLGSNNKVFKDVLKSYWGWSEADFWRSVKQQLLTQKVLQALDTDADKRANAALAAVKSGQDFGVVAKQYSDDTATKDNGGQLGFLVSKNDNNIPPQTIEALYKLKPGETSGIINLGYGLEIVKNIGNDGDKIKAARIFISYQDINKYLNEYKDKDKAQVFIKA